MARLALSGDSGVVEKWTHSNKIQEVKLAGLAEELEVGSQSYHQEQFQGFGGGTCH